MIAAHIFAASVVALSATVPATLTPAAPSDDAVSLALVEQHFAVDAGQPWQARYHVDGTMPGVVPAPTTTTISTPATSGPGTIASPSPEAPMPDADVRVVVYRPVDDRRELAEIVDGQRGTIVDSLTVLLAPTLRDGRTDLDVDVPTTTDTNVAAALTMRRPGLYPTAVQIVVDGDVVAEHRTFIERLPVDAGTAAPMNIALLAAVADPGPAPDDRQVADGRRELSAVADLAAAVDGPVTVALPPVLVRGLAGADPALATALQRALVGDEVLSLPSEQFDPSSAVAIGEEQTFARKLRDGEDLLGVALPSAPANRSGWLATSPLSTAGASLVRDLGFGLVALDMDTYSQLDGNIGGFVDTTLAVDVDLGDGGEVPAIVMSSVGELLDPQRSIGPIDAAVRILAELVTTRRELGPEQQRSVVLTAPDLGIPDPAAAAALAALAADLDDVRLAPLSALASTTDTMVVDGRRETITLPQTAGPNLAARAERIELTRVSAESAGSMQLHDDDLARWRALLDGALSTGLSDEQVDAALSAISTEAEAVREAVDAPRAFDFTLTGRSSTLRLNLRNNADERLRVVVSPRSPKLTFPEGQQAVVLTADGVTEVLIPVEARSNGTSSIEIDVLTPVIGQRVDGPVVLTANVNALTGLGQVITGGALLVLGSWWFGHFRRRRRQRLVPPTAVDAAEARHPHDVALDETLALEGARLDGTDQRTSSLPEP